MPAMWWADLSDNMEPRLFEAYHNKRKKGSVIPNPTLTNFPQGIFTNSRQIARALVNELVGNGGYGNRYRNPEGDYQ
jgi:hypothetical protein